MPEPIKPKKKRKPKRKTVSGTEKGFKEFAVASKAYRKALDAFLKCPDTHYRKKAKAREALNKARAGLEKARAGVKETRH